MNALFAAIPGIANVLLVSLLFWLIFSILGVQLFAGKFFKCLDDEGNRLPITEINNKTDCLAYADDGYRWENSKVNFDNVINGFLALFQVVSILVNLRGVEKGMHSSSLHAPLNVHYSLTKTELM